MKVLFVFLILEVFGFGIYIDFLFCLKTGGVRGGASLFRRFRGLRNEGLRTLGVRRIFGFWDAGMFWFRV